MTRDFVPLDLSRADPSPAGECAAKERGSTWWRSLDELAQTPEFEEYLHREFPENADAWLQGSRRDFLKLMAASFALAGLTGCDVRQPQEKIVPTVKLAGHQEPGKSEYFTTAMELSGVASGLVVKTQSGRPIKVEGNRKHPSSRGATSIFAQAATLDLYDPDRLTTVQHRGAIVSPEEFRQEMAALRQLCDASQGEGLRFLLRQTTSPTVHRLLNEVQQRWPQSRWYVYDPVCTDAVADGMRLAFGDDAVSLHPVYHFDQASVVLSIDCDFLAARERPLNEIADFVSVRRIAGRQSEEGSVTTPSMVKLFHLESSPTLTGAKADQRLIAGPGVMLSVLTAVAKRLEAIDATTETDGAPLTAAQTVWIDEVVAELRTASDHRSAVVAVGTSQPPHIHALAHAINVKLGAVGQTVKYVPSPLLRPADRADATGISSLVNEMSEGVVQTLIISMGIPPSMSLRTLTSPRLSGGFHSQSRWHPRRMKRRDCVNGLFLSRTSLSPGDVRSVDGIASIVQPLIEPLYDSMSIVELLSTLLALVRRLRDGPRNLA
ncbi:MAG: TAT-variant-translocated molybdopterin oxidoreductase [Planctomycetaceae bacterium]